MAMMWMNIWEDEMIYGCDAVWSLFQYKGDTKTEYFLKNTTWCSNLRCMRTSALTTPTRRSPWRPTHTSQDPLRSTEVRFKKIPPKTICFFMVVFFFTMEASIPASTHRQWRNCLIRLKALFAREQIFSFCFPVLVVQLILNFKSSDCGRRRRTRGSSIPLPQIRSGWWSWACQQIVKNPQRVSPTQHFYISVEKTFSWKILLPKKSPLSLDRPSNQNQTTFFHRRSSPPLSTTSRRTSPCSRNRSKVSWLEEFSFNNSSSERKTGSGWPVIRTNLLPNLFTWIWFGPNQLFSTMNCLPRHLLFFNLGSVFGGKIDQIFQTVLSHRFLSNIFCSQSEKQG